MFKEGQIVHIKSEAEILKLYKSLRDVPYAVTPSMEEYLGKRIVVHSCRVDPYEGNGYLVRLKDDDGRLSWHSSVLESHNIVTKKVCDVLRGL